jgi:hypothetical protein
MPYNEPKRSGTIIRLNGVSGDVGNIVDAFFKLRKRGPL